MTDRAKLELVLNKSYVSGVGCFLIASVGTVITQPTKLKQCLVIKRAGVDTERFERIAASESELDTIPALPTLVNHFKSSTYAGLTPVNGDVIHVVAPFPSVWEHLYNYTAMSYTVLDASDPSDLIISSTLPYTPFPDYGRDISFYVMRGATPIISSFTPATDGEADRDYTSGPPPDFYLANRHYDFLYSGVDDALDFIAARDAEAQALVNVLNQDIYGGTSTEIYE